MIEACPACTFRNTSAAICSIPRAWNTVQSYAPRAQRLAYSRHRYCRQRRTVQLPRLRRHTAEWGPRDPQRLGRRHLSTHGRPQHVAPSHPMRGSICASAASSRLQSTFALMPSRRPSTCGTLATSLASKRAPMYSEPLHSPASPHRCSFRTRRRLRPKASARRPSARPPPPPRAPAASARLNWVCAWSFSSLLASPDAGAASNSLEFSKIPGG